jgi:hypothetical protein
MKYNPNIKNGNPNYFILDIGIHQQNNPNIHVTKMIMKTTHLCITPKTYNFKIF